MIMDNITTFQIEERDGSIVDWVKIDKGNDEAVWMPKAVYDEMIAKQEDAKG